MSARVIGYITCSVATVVAIACGGTASSPTLLADQSGCSFSISPATFSIDATTTASAVQVTASASGCGWGTMGNDTFINVSPAGGIGSGTATLLYSQNTGAARSGTAMVAGHTIAVTQAGTTAPTPLTGTWRGTWSWTGTGVDGCAYSHGGTLSMTLTQTGSAFSGPTTAAGVQLRDPNGCTLLSTGPSTGTIVGTVSGNAVVLTMFISGTDPASQLDGTATLDATTLTATFPRPNGTSTGSGSFTLTRQ